MSTQMEPEGRSENRDKSWEVSSIQQLPSIVSASVPFAQSDQDSRSNTKLKEEPLRESSDDALNHVLEHCFKLYKLREAYPHFFFKVKGNRFGPPRSRRRILIAPPMGGAAHGGARPEPPAAGGPKHPAQCLEVPPEEEELKSSKEEEQLQQLEAWVEERKKLQALLNNCVNLEQWLTMKQPVSEQEESVLTKIKEAQEAQKAKTEAKAADASSIEHLMPKRMQKRIIPQIKAPYPESLLTLQNLLHKQKLKLVDLFNKADRTKAMKFRRTEFIKIIQGTKVPIDQKDLEDIILYLTASKKGEMITNEDLTECQKIWLDSLRDQRKQNKDSVTVTPPKTSPVPQKACIARKKFSIAHSKRKSLAPQALSALLDVPPMNTEPDSMHLTYNQMEVVGKQYREMRRQFKRKTSPLDFAEQCRMVKTGDPVVDGHCLPTTMEGEMGELVDQYRLKTHLVYMQCVKLCEKYGVPLTEKLLKRALLYPADKIIRKGNDFQKMRQPGGYYENSLHYQVGSSKEELISSSKPKQRKLKREVEKEKIITEKIRNTRWDSFAEFKKLMKNHSKRLTFQEEGRTDSLLDARLFKTQEELAQQFLQKELKRMFVFLNPLTDPNSFWPGHLLDKLRLYLPQMERNEGDALFSHVSHRCPVRPGICNPHRSWPVSERQCVTYGDPEFRKYYYYI
ncbi:EF-hand calcium-binding domain-containing protein 12 [Varanus komodoensis]|uniref:EF-hand calcium-binding domain-containing protein 12 n=1 Tax=Varanus komodoensis TaxID=61221 RepID=UPI001CF7DA86|nr:EF-hand calcium-binding domain-containing protein 12 [Varanus komodoensis]